MSMGRSIDDFRSTWQHVRGQLTYDFVACVPDARWAASPHPRYRSFAKQVRHLVCVQGVYHQALREGRADFGDKHRHYDGPLERDALVAGLRDKDAALDALLEGLAREGEERFRLDWFGGEISLGRFLDVLIQHEAIHHGQWSFYAALGEFDSPASWRLNWGF
jgi:uncharacterized damage-inducible protein DinB